MNGINQYLYYTTNKDVTDIKLNELYDIERERGTNIFLELTNEQYKEFVNEHKKIENELVEFIHFKDDFEFQAFIMNIFLDKQDDILDDNYIELEKENIEILIEIFRNKKEDRVKDLEKCLNYISESKKIFYRNIYYE